VFFEYGDDSVAQLGGVHLACEQASNLLTKVLEWGRLMSYMEKSTRYVAYDSRLSNGRYRYYRAPEILDSPSGPATSATWTASSTPTPKSAAGAAVLVRRPPPQGGGLRLRVAPVVRAKAFDALRGMLPAAASSNLGIYASGQAYEALLIRMRAHPLPEARSYADLMLTELRKVIPSWVKRVDVDDRGVAHSRYLEANDATMQDWPTPCSARGGRRPSGPPGRRARGHPGRLGSRRRGQGRGGHAVPLHPPARAPDPGTGRVPVRTEERLEIVRRYAGDRTNRRHRPGRALERGDYRFDVVSDYGAFRDLQRHRLLTVEWQDLTPAHGYTMPRVR
jgi:thymidylate synthase ThyX